ncbi:hypothetical protein GB937_009274 [Aspergillus fischeri]|nr:hypothetical protein GB937_009274 [Aspergillus fischeri]
MIRRNRKPSSCEPCRIAKVRCDHAAPICQRCQTRAIGNLCYYHPAPLTRVRDKQVRARRARQRGNQLGNRDETKDAELTEHHGKGLSPSSLSATARTPGSDTSQFLGSTSYLAALKEHPLSVLPSSPSSRCLQDEFEHWRTDHAYTFARLIRLVSAAAFHYEQIAWYYEGGRFTIIPAPLILGPLADLKEYVQVESWDGISNWESLHKAISAASAIPLLVDTTTTLDDFRMMVSGKRLRWEFVGLMLALAGISVQGRYPSHHVLELRNGEQMDVETFTKDMVLACNACLELCSRYGQANDVVVWMRYMHIFLGTEVLGETSGRVYRLFGDLVSSIYAMGLHHNEDKNIPFYLSETRRRILAVTHRTDKNIATLLGRPPRLPHHYCAVELPRDLADETLFLDHKCIEMALLTLDKEGWNTAGRFYPATVIRMRQILSVLREQVLDLSLGCRGETGRGDRLLYTSLSLWLPISDLYLVRFAYQRCRDTWEKIPEQFRYRPECWETMGAVDCLARVIVHCEYLLSVFQLHRIRCQDSMNGIKDLLDTSTKILSVIVDLTRRCQRHEVRKQLPWICLIYVIPAAGVLVSEIHRHTLSNRALPSSMPRSEIIRTLSFVISWFQTSELPSTSSSTACMELITLISRLLDNSLDYQPVLAHSNVSAPVIAGNGEGSAATGNIPGLQQGTNFDGVSDAMTLDSGARLDANLGLELASEDFLSWLDDLDLDLVTPDWIFFGE